MNKKQTAVEWLELELSKLDYDKMSNDLYLFYMAQMFDQAREMEKEQMIEFAQEVFRNRYNQITQSLGNIADDIYKETYE